MILHGDCREQLAMLGDCSVDAIVTDPPYELGFMGKKWDASGIAYDGEVWSQCLRVLKPGGHLLAFGGTRTYHRMTCAIEDAGFEIRDSLHWLYGSGFPKSLDVSKAIDKAAGAEREIVGQIRMDQPGGDGFHNGEYVGGYVRGDDRTRPVHGGPATPAAAAAAGWGTALKPAHEPIVLARKPLVGTVAANVMEYGTGALNIDASRVTNMGAPIPRITGTATLGGVSDGYDRPWKHDPEAVAARQERADAAIDKANKVGRWPANIILTHAPECADKCVPGCPVATLNEQSGELHPPGTRSKRPDRGPFASGTAPLDRAGQVINDRGGASRYFTTTEWDPELDVPFLYVAKPSRKERNAGCDGLPEGTNIYGMRPAIPEEGDKPGSINDKFQTRPSANFHPTVKPVALIRHLIRLVTPPGGTVLDPFLGSGTTAVAAILEGFNWIGCELTDDYLPIIEARVAWAENTTSSAPSNPTLTLFGDTE